MELHDTLYLGEDTLLRTHTSPVQVRTLQRYAPPVRVLCPGNVYRRDFFDATHAPASCSSKGWPSTKAFRSSISRPRSREFARRFYGGRARVRFGPSYFPFVEPGAQMDVEVDLNDGKGTRWVEILGCGMVHPNVIDAADSTARSYTGWAFGMGPARIAMSRHDIPDIRIALRFGRPFPGAVRPMIVSHEWLQAVRSARRMSAHDARRAAEPPCRHA